MSLAEMINNGLQLKGNKTRYWLAHVRYDGENWLEL